MSTITLKSIFATLPKTTRGERIVINGDPKGNNFLYVNGNSVIIRNIQNPEIADVYTEHSTATTCAKYSPSGYYIASADISGKVRIWDTVNKEHILKNEFQPFGGPIKDLTWSSDNTKIAVGGEGREKFAHVFNAETGTSVGTIMGHSKCINSVDLKPTRPFRLCTASDDLSVGFFEGPPFKFKHTLKDHSRFVNFVRYSPDGTIFVSGGADGKLIIYNGAEGTKIGELGDPAHKGGVYAISFSDDSKKLLSVSGDKTAKIWNIESSSVVSEFNLGNSVDDMQVGCLWQGSNILTASLSGNINYLDINNPTKPLRTLMGHNVPITSLAISKDKCYIFTAASDGAICKWNKNGECKMFDGNKHGNQIQKMTVTNGKLISCSMDDTVSFSDVDGNSYGEKIKLDSQPSSISAIDNLTAVACTNNITFLECGKIKNKFSITYKATSISIHPNKHELAIGGDDSQLYIYNINDGFNLIEKTKIQVQGMLVDLAYSPNGEFLAGASTARPVYCFRLPDYTDFTSSQWVYHTARVNSIQWSDDSKRLLSGGIDNSAFIWNPNAIHDRCDIKGYHPMSFVNGVGWLDANTVVTGASDSCVRIFTVAYKQ